MSKLTHSTVYFLPHVGLWLQLTAFCTKQQLKVWIVVCQFATTWHCSFPKPFISDSITMGWSCQPASIDQEVEEQTKQQDCFTCPATINVMGWTILTTQQALTFLMSWFCLQHHGTTRRLVPWTEPSALPGFPEILQIKQRMKTDIDKNKMQKNDNLACTC